MGLPLAEPTRHFASDNYAGCPAEIMRALNAANTSSHASAYGGDDLTTGRLARLVAHHFGEHAVAFPVFNGTGANVVALLAACPRHSRHVQLPPHGLCCAAA
jgi:threonine aldolase